MKDIFIIFLLNNLNFIPSISIYSHRQGRVLTVSFPLVSFAEPLTLDVISQLHFTATHLALRPHMRVWLCVQLPVSFAPARHFPGPVPDGRSQGVGDTKHRPSKVKARLVAGCCANLACCVLPLDQPGRSRTSRVQLTRAAVETER